MPKVAYSEKDRERIRKALLSVGLELMAKQGIQHTTVEQIYKRVGISRTFFYSFFATKEDLIVEALYLQQPKIIQYVQTLMADPSLSWRAAVKQFLHACCYGEKNGIAVLPILGGALPQRELPLLEHMDSWRNYLKTVLLRYPRISHWEVLNEPDLSSEFSKAEKYGPFLLESARMIKHVRPEATVMTGGFGSASSYLERVLESGGAEAVLFVRGEGKQVENGFHRISLQMWMM